MFSHEILQQTSCPYTTQQNGTVERKIRHIVKAARTLLIQANVPLSFWGDAVLPLLFKIKYRTLFYFPVNHILSSTTRL
uniref:Putative ovule protein n=1 Tax=Solanum chacoense TaxID=4108 RepID=A0A0V0GYY0_SOLCH